MPLQQLIRIQGKVQWKVTRATGGNWVAACDALKITLQAETWAEMMEDISTAIDALLKEMLRSNELVAFLKDQGWVLQSGSTIPTRSQDVRFDVPFIPALVAGSGFQRELR